MLNYFVYKRCGDYLQKSVIYSEFSKKFAGFQMVFV